MPSRFNKHTCPTSKTLSRLSEEAEAWWNRFHLAADDWGVFNADPKILKGLLWPLRDSITPRRIEKWLQEYNKAGLCCFWNDNENSWGFFISWFRHQTIKYMSQRKYPQPPKFSFQIPTEKERFSSKEITVLQNSGQCADSVRTVCGQCPPETNTETETETNTETETETNTETETETEKKTPKRECEYSSRFLKFWEIYPLKIGKRAASTAWLKLDKAEQLPADEKITDAVKKQIAWRETANGSFRPEWKHPATWLNGCCWDDVVDETPQGSVDEFTAARLDYEKQKREGTWTPIT